MRRLGIFSLGVASLTLVGSFWSVPAFAQQANPPAPRQEANPTAPRQEARQVQGKVIRTGKDQFVVKTRDNKEVTIYTNPKTTYRLNDRDVRFSDVRVGTNITTAYDLDGDRYIAHRVVVAPAEPVGGVVVQPGPPAAETVVQGRVVRVIGTDQVIIQTPDGREVAVFVGPQTAYQITDRGGAFTDLRPGVEVGINYDVRDRRFEARRIFRRNNNR